MNVTFGRATPKYSLRILSLGIHNCLGCDDVVLQFSSQNVHFLLYKLADNVDNTNTTTMAITPVVLALKLLCTMEYATMESLENIPQLAIGQGMVEMSFKIERIGPDDNTDDSEDELDMEPCTSSQARAKELERLQRRQQRGRRSGNRRRNPSMKITVVRRFAMVYDLETVIYQLNKGSNRRISVEKFHKRFFVPSQHSLDHLHNLQSSFAGNFLKLIHADLDCYREFKSDSNPFDKFIDLFMRTNKGHNNLLNKLTSNCLVAIEASRRMERHFVLKVFGEVHRIFEYITADEYTVMFYVPRLDSYQPLKQVTVDDFDLRNVRTHIKMTHVDDTIMWNQADHNIIDILLVSFQLALARIANQSILFLGQLNKLNEFVCHQYATAFFMNSIFGKDPTAPTWICNRYLQRIMELGETMNIIIFIEYPGRLTLLSEKQNVIKCKQYRIGQTDELYWRIFQDFTENPNLFQRKLKGIFN